MPLRNLPNLFPISQITKPQPMCAYQQPLVQRRSFKQSLNAKKPIFAPAEDLLQLAGQLAPLERVVPVDKVDHFQELAVEFQVVGESFLNILHQLGKKDRFLFEIRPLVQHLGITAEEDRPLRNVVPEPQTGLPEIPVPEFVYR